MQKTKRLLEILTERLPPGPGQRHNVTLADDGQGVVVTLMMGSVFYPFFLRDGTFDQSAEALAAELEALFKEAYQGEIVNSE